MPGLLPKKFPGKMCMYERNVFCLLAYRNVAEPMLPFFAAGAIVFYAINAGANAMMQCT